MPHDVLYVLAIVAVALVFDFINGFHDSANSIATVVSTRVLSPGVAVVWAAVFNVARGVRGRDGGGQDHRQGTDRAVGGGSQPHPQRADRRDLLEPHHLVRRPAELVQPRAHRRPGRRGHRQGRVPGAPAGRLGLPVSFIFVSPLLGMVLALTLTVGLSWLLKSAPAGPVDRVFRRLQLVSAALYSLSHGANDAQKTMGIIVGLLVSTQALFVHETGLAPPPVRADRRPHSAVGRDGRLHRDRPGHGARAAGGS